MKRSITPQEFVQLPLSSAIEWTILDIQRMIKIGIDIDMSTYKNVDHDSKICSVCLAGATIVGFEQNTRKINMMFRTLDSFVDGDEKICDRIKRTFNNLRFDDIYRTLSYWTGAYPKHYVRLEAQFVRIRNKYSYSTFNGYLSCNDVENLIEYLKEVSVLLKKHKL